MARVPGVPGQSVLPQGGPINVNPPQDAFGPAGDILAAGGQAASRLSEDFARHAEAQAAIDNKAAVDGATVTLAQRLGQIDESFRNDNKGIAAHDNLAGVFKQIEDTRAEVGGTLRSPAAKDAFNTASRIATLQATQRLASFASTERKDYNTRQVQGKIDLLINSANPDNFGEVMDGVAKELAFMATPQMQGWSPEEFQAKYAVVRGTAAFNITAGVAATNPGAAQKFYDAQKEFMTPQQRTQAEAYIRSSENNITVATVADEYTAKSAVAGLPQMRAAISSIEAQDYTTLGPVTKSGDRAYGKYQVMGKNIPVWTKQVLGKAMTPQQFLANPAAQDQVFDAIFGGYVEKYGSPQEAASRWFTGRSVKEGAKFKDVLGTTGEAYVAKFTSALGAQDRLDTMESNVGAGYAAIAQDPRLHGDPVLIDRAQSRYITNINQAKALNNLQTGAAKERLIDAAVNGNITDPALLQQAYPGALEDWTSLSASARRTLTTQLTAAGNAWTPERTATYNELIGLKYNNPQAFLNTDLAAHDLPQAAFRSLFSQQQQLKAKTAKDTFIQTSINKALGNEFVKQGLVSAGWEKDTPEYNRFTGALAEELSEWADANPGKKMTDQEIAKLATPLLAKRTVPARNYLFGAIPLNRTTMEVQGFQVPEAEADKIREAYRAATGEEPQDWQIGQLYQRKLNRGGR